MDTISGLPSHPLFVHVPVVLLPLAALVALVMLIKQAWFDRYKWVLLAAVGAGALGAILAASSGESLEEAVERAGEAGGALEEHAEAGEMARNLGILFFLVVVAWIFIPLLLKRRAATTGGSTDGRIATTGGVPKWFRPVIAAFVVLSAAGSVITVIDAGHSGAEQVWNDKGGPDSDDDGGQDIAP